MLKLIDSANGRAAAAGGEAQRAIKLVQVVDELDNIRNLVDAAWMAASDLSSEGQGPMRTVLRIASEKLAAARNKLEAGRPRRKDPANV